MSARRPPLVRCGCGRLHRSFNPGKKCRACVKEDNSRHAVELCELARQAESRYGVVDVGQLERIHARYVGRLPADHPWRVAGEGVNV